jgi:hypothetical protein
MPATFVPVDGRITSLEVLNIPLTGSEVHEIVSPGNEEEGNNYQVTLLVEAAFYAAFPYLATTVITGGATLATPYDILTTDTRILFNKGVGSASYALAPLASSMARPYPLLIKDFKGDAGVNPIQISFTGGELCDGLATITIANPYGWVTINPAPSGGSWYQS